MTTNLTSSIIKDTYGQLLHLSGGPTATEKVAYSGDGVATALKIGTGSVSIDNIRFDSSLISSIAGSLSIQPASGSLHLSAVNITSGVISGITDIAIEDGGTGASDASGARVNLGLGTVATQNSDSINITGGSITNVTFTGSFTGITSITSDSFKAVENIGYTTGSGGTVTQTTSRTTDVTLHAPSGQITLTAGSIAGLTSQEFTLTNSYISATDVVLVSFGSGLTSATYDVTVTETSNGSCKISIHNVNNSATPSDTPVINFVVFKGVNS